MKRFLLILSILFAGLILAGCSAADTSILNNKQAAENFELQRRIVFVNGITDSYLLEIEGRCSFEDEGTYVEVVCKTGVADNGQALTLRHVMGLSDNVTYVVEQLEENEVDTYHYRIVFRPETIAPYIDLQTSGDLEGDG